MSANNHLSRHVTVNPVVKRDADEKIKMPFLDTPGYTEIRSWNLPDGARARFGQSHVNDMALSQDGKYLAVASDVGVWWYNLFTQSLMALWDGGQGPYTAITFSTDGRWIALGDRRGVATVWEVSNGTFLAEFATGAKHGISELAFSFDNQHLASGGGPCENGSFFLNVWRMPRRASAPAAPACVRVYEGTAPLAFSPGNRLLACADRTPSRCISPREGGSISVWDVETHKCIARLTGLPFFVGSLSFSPCGKYLAGGDWGGTVNVWEIPSGHLHQAYPTCGDSYMLVSYSPGGVLRAAAVSREGPVVVWDVEKSERLYLSKSHSRYFPSQFFYGTQLAFGTPRDFHVWTVEKGQQQTVRHEHVCLPESLHFSPYGKVLLARTRHGGIFSWDVATLDHPPSVFKPRADTSDSEPSEVYLAVAAAPDGKLFTISAAENIIRLWEIENNTPIATFITQAEPASAAFSPTANRLAYRDKDDQIYVWDVQSASVCYTDKGEDTADIPQMEFSSNGKYLLIHSDGLYNVEQREKVQCFPTPEIQFHAFSPCSTRVAGETRDTLLLWDIQRCETILSLSKPPNWEESEVESLAFSPCGQYLAACPIHESVETVQLQIWSILSGKMIRVYDLPGEAECLAFSPDSTLLASGSSDGTILLWEMKSSLENESS